MSRQATLVEQIDRKVAGNWARWVQLQILAKGDVVHALAMASHDRDYLSRNALQAKMNGGSFEELYTKAGVSPGSTSDSTWAGPLAPLVPLESEFANYLRPLTVIGRLPVRDVPFQMSFGAVTTGVVNSAFFAEGLPMPCASMSLQRVNLGFAKVGVVIPLSDDLARFSSPSAQAVIVDDCSRAMAGGIDAAFLDPSFAAVAGVNPASITHGVSPITSTGATADKVMADLKSLLFAMDAGRFPLQECWFVVTQKCAAHLATLRTTTNAAAFPDLQLDGTGRLLGLPCLVSGNVVDRTSSPPGEMIVLCHPASIAVADAGVETDVSKNAALQLSTSPAVGAQNLTSLWQSDLTAIRLRRYISWQTRRAGAVQFISGLSV